MKTITIEALASIATRSDIRMIMVNRDAGDGYGMWGKFFRNTAEGRVKAVQFYNELTAPRKEITYYDEKDVTIVSYEDVENFPDFFKRNAPQPEEPKAIGTYGYADFHESFWKAFPGDY